ncbi:MAG TPA: response regulator [Methylocystis sp.]|nr:response regulator [Methylocystis sp.]
MPLSKEIAPHLPYLRRYARALTGSQASGDAYVVSTLEAIIEDPKAFPTDHGVRAGLYKVFSQLWSSLAINCAEGAIDEASPHEFSSVERNLAALTPRSRQAFLLKSVESFTDGEIASILSVPIGQVHDLIAECGREMARCVSTDVLIIEDEVVISADLAMIAQDLGHSVIGVARTRDEARTIVKEKKPGLVLADIQLADGSSGIDAANDIISDLEVPIIFITAYPERLLTGERPEPTFLISKPYRVDAVKATISQSLFFDRKASKRKPSDIGAEAS